MGGSEEYCENTVFAAAYPRVVMLPENTAKSNRVVNLSFTKSILANDIERILS